MSKHLDITPLIQDWNFDPSQVTARMVEVENAELPEVQLRLDLGILQMKLNGRPDGQQPHGYESALKYYRQRILTERRSGYRLDGDACSELQQECVQVYYRYLALMVLKDFDRVIRDTAHSMEIFDLVEKYSESEDIMWDFLQFKPYVIMMNTRAKAEKLAANVQLNEAIEQIETGMNEIEAFLVKMEDDPESIQDCQELSMLEELIRDLRERGDEENPVIALKQKLQHAVRAENFEEAAKLRDSIQKIEVEAAPQTLNS
ncbi:UvrB/UvrC motif-containing protein [Kiritimatiellaeota bacterium B1221]|nr:UvrB/UvrC motif-containing protein [Kiritimatiellaeota bacterium B1221]